MNAPLCDRGKTVSARPQQFELLVYRSQHPHAVSAVTAGRRVAVALEFWHVQAEGQGSDHPHYDISRVEFDRRRTPPSVARSTRVPGSPEAEAGSYLGESDMTLECPL